MASVQSPTGTWYGMVVSPPKASGGDYTIRIGGSDRTVTVPSAQVGLHPAFAGLRSRHLSADTNDRIERVMARDPLMAQDTCTQVMAGIMSLLGTSPGTPVAKFDGTGPDGLYSLVVNFGEDINTPDHDPVGWEHGMIFQKCGDEVVLYQGWVGVFTLRDWLRLTPACMSLASARYAPRHPSFRPQHMKTYFAQLHQLPATWDTIVTSNLSIEIFAVATEYLFGPDSRVGRLQLGATQIAGKKLRYHWKHSAFR